MRSDFVIKVPLSSLCRKKHEGQEEKQGTQARVDGGPNQTITMKMMVRNRQAHDRLGRREPRDWMWNMRRRRKKMTLGSLEMPNFIFQPREAQ